MENNKKRTDGAILKDLIAAVVRHESNRDEEWVFHDEHPDPAFWNKDMEEEHQKILDDITESHNCIMSLIVEATGDKDYIF